MRYPITPGRYRNRIQLQAPAFSATPGPGGDPVQTWNNGPVVFADVVALSGRELVNAKQTKESISTRIRLRYLGGIDSTWRAQFNGQIYNFESVIDLDSRRIELEILASITAGETA